jgi:ribose-phosphate pyrophosphokinase
LTLAPYTIDHSPLTIHSGDRSFALEKLKVFSGSAHPELARAICAHLGVPLGAAKLIRFTNENLKVKIEENVREADVFVVQPSRPPVNEGLMELLIMIDALRSASAARITAVTPYYPYVRSDKKDEPRISITARLVADLLQAAGANRVLAVDLHSPQVQGFFSIPSDHLTARTILVDYFRRRPDLADHVVVAPDAGEVKDAAGMAKRLGVPLAMVDKRRYGDDENARAVHLVGDVKGKRALIVDDEIATGGTVVESAEFVMREGARDVTVAVVHPVFSGPAVQRLRNSAAITEVVVTDSIPLPPEKQDPKFTVLSVSALIADAIARIHDGRSISAMFER